MTAEVIIFDFYHWVVDGRSLYWDHQTSMWSRLRQLGYTSANVVDRSGKKFFVSLFLPLKD